MRRRMMSARRSALRSSRLLLFSILATPCLAQPLGFAETGSGAPGLFAYAPQEQPIETPSGAEAASSPHVVPYAGHERAGTVIVDTPNTQLFLVLGGGKALR